jgi:hypothetical protein
MGHHNSDSIEKVLQILPENRSVEQRKNDLKKGEHIDDYEDVIRMEIYNDEQLVDEEMRMMQVVEKSQESLTKEEVK